MTNKINVDEVVIDGETYVKKGSYQPEMAGNYFIVRTRSAGVFAGEKIKREGQEVTLRNARRLWYWDGAASLSELAMEGTRKPDTCKFPCEVDEVLLTEMIEMLPCSTKAQRSIKGVKVWTA